MSPARHKVKITPRKTTRRNRPQKLKRLDSKYLNPNTLKLAAAGVGLLLLSLIPVVGLVILIAVGIHHFSNAKR